jgi:hypothetical protein
VHEEKILAFCRRGKNTLFEGEGGKTWFQPIYRPIQSTKAMLSSN